MNYLLHPRPDVLKHMGETLELLWSCMMIFGVIGAILNELNPLSTNEIAWLMLFAVCAYSFAAIANSLEIMGFIEPLEEDDDELC